MRGLVVAGADDRTESSLPYPQVGPPRPLTPTVLHQVIDRLAARRSAGGSPAAVVIFDLDSTLLDNRPRQARIVREFAVEKGQPLLAACTPRHFAGWSLRAPLVACGLGEEAAAELEPALRRFWRRRFFTSAYCIDDIALPGAVAFVAAVLGQGARVAYCTGRPESMREGTERSLAGLGFPPPDGARVQLLMKPQGEQHDDEFKRQVRPQLVALGEVVAAFDNEPAHINIHADSFPAALCVHLATDESLRPIALHAAIPSIANFVLP